LDYCVPISGVYVKLDSADQNADKIFAQLLTTHENRKLAKLKAKTAPGADCVISYVTTGR
jgi:hypothetical protein